MPGISVTQTKIIGLPCDEVYRSVRNFRKWPAWSPWLIHDPHCELSFVEDGSSYSWKGKLCGEGSLSVSGEEENSWITQELDFLAPWKSQAKTRFDFQEEAGGTRVTWSMESSLPWFLFFLKDMMQCTIEQDYDRGLEMLKDHLERGEISSNLEILGRQSQEAFRYLGIKGECVMADLQETMGDAFAQLQEKKIKPNAPAFCQYHRWDFKNRIVGYTMGVPTDEDIRDDLVEGEFPACEVFQIQHTGNYRHLGNAWSAVMLRARSKFFKTNRKIPPFEIYDKVPGEGVSEDETLSTVCMPIK